VNKGTPPAGRARALPDGTSGAWARLAAFVQRHPAPLAAAAAAVMLVLAIPVLSLRLGSSDAANDPAATTTHHAYELLATGFGPGFNGPAATGRHDQFPR
jgi:putative drug exporter of the RND superfamily